VSITGQGHGAPHKARTRVSQCWTGANARAALVRRSGGFPLGPSSETGREDALRGRPFVSYSPAQRVIPER